MRKRYVKLTMKGTGKTYAFPTVRMMYKKLKDSTLGVTINSLWNALSKNGGFYENDRVKVEYRNTIKIDAK